MPLIQPYSPSTPARKNTNTRFDLSQTFHLTDYEMMSFLIKDIADLYSATVS